MLGLAWRPQEALRIQIEGFWKDGDSKKSKTYYEDKQGHVGVDDGSGVQADRDRMAAKFPTSAIAVRQG